MVMRLVLRIVNAVLVKVILHTYNLKPHLIFRCGFFMILFVNNLDFIRII